jgi:heptaprenylglyceryl phosphate synthase
VGGGIRSAETAKELIEAGADILVIGNKAQEQPAFLNELYEKVK